MFRALPLEPGEAFRLLALLPSTAKLLRIRGALPVIVGSPWDVPIKDFPPRTDGIAKHAMYCEITSRFEEGASSALREGVSLTIAPTWITPVAI